MSYTVKRLTIELAVFCFTGKSSADKPREFEGRALITSLFPLTCLQSISSPSYKPRPYIDYRLFAYPGVGNPFQISAKQSKRSNQEGKKQPGIKQPPLPKLCKINASEVYSVVYY